MGTLAMNGLNSFKVIGIYFFLWSKLQCSFRSKIIFIREEFSDSLVLF